MMAEDLVRKCRGRTVPHESEPFVCLCGNLRFKSLRTEVKEFETIAAARAEANGEKTVTIETDKDLVRILFSGIKLCGCGGGTCAHPGSCPCSVVDWWPFPKCCGITCHIGIGRNFGFEPRCAICLREIFLEQDNSIHIQEAGCCSRYTKLWDSSVDTPEEASCYSKHGLRVVWTLPRGAEIYRMRSNDKDTGVPSMTFGSIRDAETKESWRRASELTAMATHDKINREIERMASNDYRIELRFVGNERSGPVYENHRVPFAARPAYRNYEKHLQNKRRRTDKYACGAWNCWKHAGLDRVGSMPGRAAMLGAQTSTRVHIERRLLALACEGKL